MNISIIKVEPLVAEVGFTEDALSVRLADGRVVSIPLEWLPGIRDASDRLRKDYRLIAGGVGIHWNALDEDVMVEDLLAFGPNPKARPHRARPMRQSKRCLPQSAAATK